MKNLLFHDSVPGCDELELFVNGEKVQVLKTDAAYFACTACDGKASVEIRACKKIGDISISPLELGIKARMEECTASFELDGNFHVYIQMQEISRPLFIYGDRATEEERKQKEEAAYCFKGGQVYEAGEIVLKDGECLFIEDGAVVKGVVRAQQASHVKICGRGVLDGSYFPRNGETRRTILLDRCTDVEIRDLIVIQPSSWMIMVAGCRRVHIDNVKEIGEVVGSDGVDVVGSSEVVIENCIFRNNDDCVAIKALERNDPADGRPCGWNRDVSDITVRKCIFVNDKAGNAMEIGHELQCSEVRSITFEDIDVVCVHGHGAAFSIHAGDRAVVRDILFKNIRVEHYYDKLVDFRIMCSRFNQDEERGQLRNVLLKDINVRVSEFNPGYSVSVIGGYDEGHTAEDIMFDNFYLGGKKVLHADQLDLFTKNAKNITFR